MSPTIVCDDAPRDPDLWEIRLQALLDTLQTMEGHAAALAAPRSTTIKTLVKCLTEFAPKQFCYFHTLFTSNRSALNDNFPPEYAYAITLDQIQNDIDVLQRIMEQREDKTVAVRDTLLRSADRLASLALSHAVKARLIETDPAALTYFHKQPAIRVVPYADVALVAVPFLTLTSRRDFLAIPHEIGHFVFWYGKRRGTPIYRLVREGLRSSMPANTPDFQEWYHWAEEVFADVYGCLVAGPVIAVDFQDLQEHNSRAEFLNGDHKHPVPALRPFIYQRVLQARAPASSHWNEWAKKLWLEWFEHLMSQHSGEKLRLPRENSTQAENKVSIDFFTALFVLPQKIQELVDLALELLDGVETGDWAGDPAISEDVYRAFEVTNFGAIVVKGIIHEEDSDFDWPKWKAALDVASANWHAENSTKTKPDPDWLPTLAAAGWATEGPQDRWP